MADIEKFVHNLNLPSDDLDALEQNLQTRLDLLQLEFDELARTKYQKEVATLSQTTRDVIRDSAKLRDQVHGYIEEVNNELSLPKYQSSEDVDTQQGEVAAKMAEVEIELGKLAPLVSLKDCLERMEASSNQHSHDWSAVRTLLDIESSLVNTRQSELSIPSEICTELDRRIGIFRQLLLQNVIEAWSRAVRWDVLDTGFTQLTLGQREVSPAELLHCLYSLGNSDKTVRVFGERLNTFILTPLAVQNPPCNLRLVERRIFVELETEVDNSASRAAVSQRSIDCYMKLFEWLQKMFEWENPIEDSASKFELMPMLGKFLESSFCDLLQQQCIQESIPGELSQLTEFWSLIGSMRSLHEQLTRIKFCTPSSSVNWCLDEESARLMVTKFYCSSYMDRARSLIKKPMHEIDAVKSTNDADITLPLDNEKAGKLDLNIPSMADFSACQVSSGTVQLASMIEQIVKECEKFSDHPDLCARLWSMCRNICEVYVELSRHYHKQHIDDFPYYAAIFYNNCNYLGHRLSLLELSVHESVLRALGGSMYASPSFADVIPRLTNTGQKAIMHQLQIQRDELSQIIQEACADFGGNLTQEGFLAAEKKLKQCILRLESVHKVWTDALPLKSARRALGWLVTRLLDKFVDRILSLEDIPAKEAAWMAEGVCSLIRTRITCLFGDAKSSEVHHYCDPAISQIKEIEFVLNASLHDILDRWADGQGPLAIYFRPLDLQKLIRALFQNNERRAAVLAKIKM